MTFIKTFDCIEIGDTLYIIYTNMNGYAEFIVTDMKITDTYTAFYNDNGNRVIIYNSHRNLSITTCARRRNNLFTSKTILLGFLNDYRIKHLDIYYNILSEITNEKI